MDRGFSACRWVQRVPEDLAALEEMVDILTTAGTREAIAEGLDDLAAGRIADNDALRARLASR